MGRIQHLNKLNRILLATGLLLAVGPLFGAILWMLQYSTTPPVLPPTGQPGLGMIGAIPIGIFLIALSVWLNKK
jgi:hypothetical protein